ncbi:MAG: VOC family protein [Acidimicrobiia bacterium]
MKIEQMDVGLVSATGALADFYADVLGLARLEPRQFPFATVHRLACGPVTLKVMVPADPPETPATPDRFWDRVGFRYLTLWVDDLGSLADRWSAGGGTVAMAPTEIRPGVESALLVDPDGNVVEAMRQAAGA